MNPSPAKNISSLRKASGFTLMELLVVMVIVAILFTITVGSLKYVNAKQNQEKCKVDIGLLSKGLEEFKMDRGQFPLEQGTGAVTLYEALYWDTDLDGSPIGQDPDQRTYVAELDPNNVKAKLTQAMGATFRVVDPWFNDYNYRRGALNDGSPNPDAKNADFDLWSAGKDGKFTPQDKDPVDGDNITNWR